MRNPSSTSSSDLPPGPSAVSAAPAPGRRGPVRFFAGLLCVAALAAAGQYGIDALWPPKFGWTLRRMPEQCENTLVFLGDSINASYAADDENPMPLSELISHAADHHIGAVALGGYDMRTFLGYIRTMRPRISPDRPRTWILTVNLATYSGDGRSAWVRNKIQIAMVNQLLHRTSRAFAHPMRIFRFPAYRPDLRAEEEQRRPVLWQGAAIGRQRDFPDSRFKVASVTDDLRRENIILRYGQPLQDGNLELLATTGAARLLRALGQRAVFCVMPCDVERCDALLDGCISPILDAKAAAVAAAARAGGGEVLDLHSAFPHEWFVPDQYPNEHLRNPGREALASAIASFLLTNAPPAP